MKRKLLIGIPVALVVAGLALVLLRVAQREPARASVNYVSQTDGDPTHVWFTIQNELTNRMFFHLQEQRQTNGVWSTLPGEIQGPLQGKHAMIHTPIVTSGTNVWRVAVHYSHPPDPTWSVRLRMRLSDLADQRRWRRLSYWISPTKLKTIYGPEMIGNKPVEQQ